MPGRRGAGLKGVRLVIFDWSGVISDDRRPVYEANMRMLEARGKKRMGFEEWLPRTTLTPIEFLADHGVTGDSDALFDEYRSTLAQVRKEGIHPVAYADAKDALAGMSLGGRKLVVISSHPEDHLLSEAAEYGLKGYFSRMVGNVKDKAAAISRICSEEGVAPSEAAYVGDTVYDVRAARKAGVHQVAMTTGYHVGERLAAEDPEFVVGSLSELGRLLG